MKRYKGHPTVAYNRDQRSHPGQESISGRVVICQTGRTRDRTGRLNSATQLSTSLNISYVAKWYRKTLVVYSTAVYTIVKTMHLAS